MDHWAKDYSEEENYFLYIYMYMNIFVNIQLQHKKVQRHYLFGMSGSKIKKLDEIY